MKCCSKGVLLNPETLGVASSLAPRFLRREPGKLASLGALSNTLTMLRTLHSPGSLCFQTGKIHCTQTDIHACRGYMINGCVFAEAIIVETFVSISFFRI